MLKKLSISISQKMKFNFLFLLIGCSLFSNAQESYSSQEINVNQFVTGTLLSPVDVENPDLVILIQGSGPTDRDGNQPFLKNDSFKKLAQELCANGIASFRFDKRISAMGRLNLTEEEMRFDDFVQDAASVISYAAENIPHDRLFIAGHSQGSLVGMLAAKGKADGFISIAGAAQPIDSIIVNQLDLQMPGLGESARSAFRTLREEGTVTDFNPYLASILRPQIQAFMLSWMKYNPTDEIAKLEMPILIISGTEDLQVNEQEAKTLHSAVPQSTLVELEGMNHILRQVSADPIENQKSYNEPNRPLHPNLVDTVLFFLEELRSMQ